MNLFEYLQNRLKCDMIYLSKYKELRDEAVYVLSFYANVYTNVVTEPDEAHEEASKKLRDIGVKFEVFATNESYSSSEIPSNADLKEVSREFIGLSNSMYIYKGGDIGRLIDANSRREEKIRSLLRM